MNLHRAMFLPPDLQSVLARMPAVDKRDYARLVQEAAISRRQELEDWRLQRAENARNTEHGVY